MSEVLDVDDGGEDLLPREKLFVKHYLATLSPIQALRAAGYKGATHQQASKLRTRPRVAAAISSALAGLTMSSTEVAVRLSEQARAPYASYFDPETKTFNLDDLFADGYGHLIKRVRVADDGSLEIDWYGAQEALTLLARIHGMLQNRTIVSGPGGGPVRTQVETVVAPDLSRLTDEELEVWQRLLMKAAADEDASS